MGKDIGMDDMVWDRRMMPTPEKYRKADIRSGAQAWPQGPEVPEVEITPERLSASVREGLEVAYAYDRKQRAKNPDYQSTYFATSLVRAIRDRHLTVEEAMVSGYIPTPEKPISISPAPGEKPRRERVQRRRVLAGAL